MNKDIQNENYDLNVSEFYDLKEKTAWCLFLTF